MFLITLYFYVNRMKRAIGLQIEREPYSVGKTGFTMSKCFELLTALGYTWDYWAWEDIGEGISMRITYLTRMVHVRVFTDGEIRMHDELNYEIDPQGHYNSSTLKPADDKEILRVSSVLIDKVKA